MQKLRRWVRGLQAGLLGTTFCHTVAAGSVCSFPNRWVDEGLIYVVVVIILILLFKRTSS